MPLWVGLNPNAMGEEIYPENRIGTSPEMRVLEVGEVDGVFIRSMQRSISDDAILLGIDPEAQNLQINLTSSTKAYAIHAMARLSILKDTIKTIPKSLEDFFNRDKPLKTIEYIRKKDD